MPTPAVEVCGLSVLGHAWALSQITVLLSSVQLNSVIPASKWPRIDLWVAALAKSVGNSQNAHALGERGYKLSSAIPLWQTCKKDLFR